LKNLLKELLFRPYILVIPHSLNNYGYVGTEAINNARWEILEAIRLSPKERFVLKMHPSANDSQFYQQWKEVKGIKNCKAVGGRTATPFIKRAKLVIVQHSSVALEAVELGKDVVLVEDEVSDVLGEFMEFPKSTFMRARTHEDILRLINDN